MRSKTLAAAGAALCALLAGCGETAEEPGNETSANEVAQQLAQLRIEPGLWERSTEVMSISAAGMPVEAARRRTGPRDSARNCITPEQAARPNATFLATRENSNCSYRDFVMEGGRMSGTMTCSGRDGRGEIRTFMQGEYRPQGYDVRMRMVAPMANGEEMTTEVRVRGRRVGECEGEMSE